MNSSPDDRPPLSSPDADLDPNDPIDLAFREYLRSCDRGEAPPRKEFLARFPAAVAEELSELMSAADRIGEMTGIYRAPAVHIRAGAADASVADDRDPDIDSVSGPSSATDGFDTVAADVGQADSGVDVALTLPMPGRKAGDEGPTLPFDLGDYELLEVLGRGGMGVVYLARQRKLDRLVAVKMIRSGILASEAEVRRFNTEAQAAARLHHPGIVSVHQFGKLAGHHYFSMEHIEGTDLQKQINERTLAPEEAVRYVRDVALAIAHAHDRGVLHRDLKPANVLIDADGGVHITDFGLAKHVDDDSSLTGSGHAVGTPHYMPPEQAVGHGDRVDHRSDVYSLGAVLFAALAGRPPIVADNVMQTLMDVAHVPAPSVRSIRGEIPVDLDTIIAKCLEKDPRRRYQSMRDLAADLDRFLSGHPIQARPRSAPVRAMQFVAGVPVIRALSGRRVVNPSAAHQRFQAAMLLMMLMSPLVVAAALMYVRHVRQAMPSVVQVASGEIGGVYDEVANHLSRTLSERSGVPVTVTPTMGSVENRMGLIRGDFHLAPMQATSVSGDSIRVVAPLFYEVLYVLSHRERGVEEVADIRGHTIAVGPPGSGSREAAELMFESLDMDESTLELRTPAWERLPGEDDIDVVILCMGRQSELVSGLLASGDWQLLAVPNSIEIALQHPTLRPMEIPAMELPKTDRDRGGIATVGTTAFLACRVDAPEELVTQTLVALYAEPPTNNLIPKSQAAEWQGLAFHPAARKFFEQ